MRPDTQQAVRPVRGRRCGAARTRLGLGLGLLLAALVVAGCGSLQRDGEARAPSPGTSEGARDEAAVEIRGVESCRALTRMYSSKSAGRPDGSLASVTLPCLTPGPPVDLARLRGRPVVVNLWASWCGPCRAEMPILQAAYEKFGEQVQFVGVDTRDSAEPAAELLRSVGVTYPQLADIDAGLLTSLRIPGLPVTVIVSSEGAVVEKHVGAFDGDDLDNLLADLVSDG